MSQNHQLYPNKPNSSKEKGLGWPLVIGLLLLSLPFLTPLLKIWLDRTLTICCKKRIISPTGNIKEIANGAQSWYGEQKTTEEGHSIPRHFPSATSPNKITSGTYINPPQKPCSNGNAQYRKNGDIWDKEPWKSLKFGINKAHYHQYVYIADNNLKSPSFTILAHADLDCDGILSTYRMTATKAASGEIIRDSLVITKARE